MKKNMMRRNLHQTIKRSIARFIAIVTIIALGAAIFVGLRTTKSDMIATGQQYMDEQNMFDLRFLNSYGWSMEQEAQIEAMPGVVDAEGVISIDAIVGIDSGKESPYKLYAIPDKINKIYLHSGRMPSSEDECLLDVYNAPDNILGKKISISDFNDEETLDALTVKHFTVVGLISSPLYMDMSRGNTSLGNGTLTGFLYMPRESFNVEYYTELAVTLQGDDPIYTEQYHDWVQHEADRIFPMVEKLMLDRYDSLYQDVNQIYAEGLQKYEDGLKQYREEKDATFGQLESTRIQLEQGSAELDALRLAVSYGRNDLEASFLALSAELEKGWEQYYSGFAQASEAFRKAWVDLESAKKELMLAQDALDDMTMPELYALGRISNMGYIALENNSDIVEGVSTVFPVFFLLIAAMVCITTMTRMVEDERIQIGTLKALGYSSFSIIGKYFWYAGSAAVLGCGFGVIVGSIIFPLILWDAYQIIITLGKEFVLQINWPLCLTVLFVYIAVTLAVTWYCCHKSLKEAPAQLIRPKAPASGKNIFLEKLPFWNRISFLNKVMLRNIFRYRQRLLMMLLGVGGCTALLLTGFGLRDSIGDLADIQFDEIILYDHEIRFDAEITQEEMKDFSDFFVGKIEKTVFYHQSSMELSFEEQIANVNFLAADSEIGYCIDFHDGEENLLPPKEGEALVSVGMAERLGISIGDTIVLRDENMRALSLKVAGIFDNNVYNYVVTTPATVAEQWGETPEVQMACTMIFDGQDPYIVGAQISEYDGVMNVVVNEDVRSSVGQMLNALDLVVITVVFCATLLAVTVTYNLTNINITERLREIATIKVLGFRAYESAAYVFKENLLLSAMGSVLGMGGGVLLLDFVISEIQVDLVWLTPRLVLMSFIYSAVITLLSAVIVDFVLFFKLQKINMAEALKSVE